MLQKIKDTKKLFSTQKVKVPTSKNSVTLDIHEDATATTHVAQLDVSPFV